MFRINDSLVTYNKDKIIASDLLEEADKGGNSRVVVGYDMNTLNTPYTDGLSDKFKSGTALISMSSQSYGQITAFIAGSSQIFTRSKNLYGWSDWTEVITTENKEDGFDVAKMFTMRTLSSENIEIPKGGSVYAQTIDIPVIEGYKPYVISWFRLYGTGYAECSLSELYVHASNNQVVYGIRNNGTVDRTLGLSTRVLYINTSVLNF